MNRAKAANWSPDRRDIIWIDCNQQTGLEMRDVHPFLVLSPRLFNERTSLVIGLPMTTSDYNADNPFAVAVGTTRKQGASKASFVLCHQPNSFDWRVRQARPHPLKRLGETQFADVCAILNQIVQIA